MPTIREVWIKGSLLLKETSPTHTLDSQILLCSVLNETRENFWKNPDRLIELEEEEKFFSLLEKRGKKIPLAYLIKEKEFFSLLFFVDERVLIPRPDTEILVEEALKTLKEEKNINTIWDIGTGSGAIGLSLAKNSPDLNFNLVDISLKALDVAQKNKESLEIINANLFHSNLLELWEDIPPYSLILANLPYLTEEETELKERDYPCEPSLALLGGGEEGLNLIEELLKQVLSKKRGPIWVLLESSTWQIPKIYELMTFLGFKNLAIFQDLSGHDRIIKGSII